jgi:hypothetical protein
MIKSSFNLFQKNSLVQSSKLQRSKYLQEMTEQILAWSQKKWS